MANQIHSACGSCLNFFQRSIVEQKPICACSICLLNAQNKGEFINCYNKVINTISNIDHMDSCDNCIKITLKLFLDIKSNRVCVNCYCNTIAHRGALNVVLCKTMNVFSKKP